MRYQFSVADIADNERFHFRVWGLWVFIGPLTRLTALIISVALPKLKGEGIPLLRCSFTSIFFFFIHMHNSFAIRDVSSMGQPNDTVKYGSCTTTSHWLICPYCYVIIVPSREKQPNYWPTSRWHTTLWHGNLRVCIIQTFEWNAWIYPMAQ